MWAGDSQLPFSVWEIYLKIQVKQRLTDEWMQTYPLQKRHQAIIKATAWGFTTMVKSFVWGKFTKSAHSVSFQIILKKNCTALLTALLCLFKSPPLFGSGWVGMNPQSIWQTVTSKTSNCQQPFQYLTKISGLSISAIMSFDKCIFFGVHPKVRGIYHKPSNLGSQVPLGLDPRSTVPRHFNWLDQSLTSACQLFLWVKSGKLQKGEQREICLCGEKQGGVLC